MRIGRLIFLTALAVPPFGVQAQSVPPGLPSGQLSRYPGNPLVRNGPEKYDYWKTGPRVVLEVGPADYRMWYEAVGADTLTYVALATSRDGLSWTKKGVVMTPSGMDTWEKKEVSPDMQFNQFLLTPYFGPGLLPHAQTLWIDELAVGTQRLGVSKD